MGKNKRGNTKRPMKHPPRSASAARRMVLPLAPEQIDIQQAVSVIDLVEDRIITQNGKGDIFYAGE